eukprot:m.618287 g.618287  ORF g.618287 m.618287 type:complete len:158 (-) comp22527_c1_seq14:1761-2234(-)
MAAAGATDLVIRNHEKHKELAKLVESLVTSGKPVLDKDILKTIKKDCRLYDECIRTVFKTVVVFMDEMHAQIRLGCLRLVEYLYFRSVLFREMMTTDFQTVVRCCIGLDDAYVRNNLRVVCVCVCVNEIEREKVCVCLVSIPHDFLLLHVWHILHIK